MGDKGSGKRLAKARPLLGETEATIDEAMHRALDHMANPLVGVTRHGVQLMLERAVLNGFVLGEALCDRAVGMGVRLPASYEDADDEQ